MNLDRATCVVTGASGGIGGRTAELLAGRGARLIVSGRARDALDRLADRIGARVITADLATSDGVEELATTLRELRPDVLVNAAGRGLAGPLAGTAPTEMVTVVSVNLVAPMALSRSVLASMLERGHGQIVNVGSIVGHTGNPNESVYAASKGGLVAFTESLRQECLGSGVGVSLVTPGVVDTPFFERRGVAYDRRWPTPIPPGRVAEAILYAIEHDRAELIVPRWLTVAARLHGGLPGVYRALASRFG